MCSVCVCVFVCGLVLSVYLCVMEVKGMTKTVILPSGCVESDQIHILIVTMSHTYTRPNSYSNR